MTQDFGSIMTIDDSLQQAYLQAYHFAAEAHQGQIYPGTQISYIMHISFVAMEVQQALAYHRQQTTQPLKNERVAIQCALLHDVLEDCDVTADTLSQHFDQQVVLGVMALSKNPSLPKEEQMLDSLLRIKQQIPEIAMVKLADRTCNLQQPPSYWSTEKRQRYHQQAQQIWTHLSFACPYLSARLHQKIQAYNQYF